MPEALSLGQSSTKARSCASRSPRHYAYGELDKISLAYATTVHKSQGSGYPAVVIPLATQHYQLLERNLLYTAVTRGRRLVVVIGQVKALAIAVKRVGSVKRLTYLRQRLEGVIGARGGWVTS